MLSGDAQAGLGSERAGTRQIRRSLVGGDILRLSYGISLNFSKLKINTPAIHSYFNMREINYTNFSKLYPGRRRPLPTAASAVGSLGGPRAAPRGLLLSQSTLTISFWDALKRKETIFRLFSNRSATLAAPEAPDDRR